MQIAYIWVMDKLARVVALFSLLLNFAITAALVYAYTEYRAATVQLAQTAGQISDALKALGSAELKTTVKIDQVIQVHTTVPVRQNLVVPIEQNLPIDTALQINPTLPVFGPVTLDVPVKGTVPIKFSVPVDFNLDVPINADVPVKFDIPVAIKISDTELKPTIDALVKVLER